MKVISTKVAAISILLMHVSTYILALVLHVHQHIAAEVSILLVHVNTYLLVLECLC